MRGKICAVWAPAACKVDQESGMQLPLRGTVDSTHDYQLRHHQDQGGFEKPFPIQIGGAGPLYRPEKRGSAPYTIAV